MHNLKNQLKKELRADFWDRHPHALPGLVFGSGMAVAADMGFIIGGPVGAGIGAGTMASYLGLRIALPNYLEKKRQRKQNALFDSIPIPSGRLYNSRRRR
jgi:hypothetical protein